MLKRVVVAIDGLTEQQRQRIASHVDGWAVIDFVPEKTDDWRHSLGQAEVVFGWPAPQSLGQSDIRFFQLPSSQVLFVPDRSAYNETLLQQYRSGKPMMNLVIDTQDKVTPMESNS